MGLFGNECKCKCKYDEERLEAILRAVTDTIEHSLAPSIKALNRELAWLRRISDVDESLERLSKEAEKTTERIREVKAETINAIKDTLSELNNALNKLYGMMGNIIQHQAMLGKELRRLRDEVTELRKTLAGKEAGTS